MRAGRKPGAAAQRHVLTQQGFRLTVCIRVTETVRWPGKVSCVGVWLVLGVAASSLAGSVWAKGDHAALRANQSDASPAVDQPRVQLLAVVINDQSRHETERFLRRGRGSQASLYVSTKVLDKWRIHEPDQAAYDYHGDAFYALDAIRGLQYHVDKSTQTLHIEAPVDAFKNNVVSGTKRQAKPESTAWGGYFNYDLIGTRVQADNRANGLFEAGLYNNWGVGTAHFKARDIGRSRGKLIRLDTTWRHDNPSGLTTLKIGDSITRSGLTGRAVRLGGVQFGTNFDTRPYLTTFPTPGLSGRAAVPSTVDLYVNGLLKRSRDVPAGPFSVPNVPVMTGAGRARVVVRNALGRQQTVSTSFYTSSQLLKQGLNDYSVSLGALRDNYGIESNDYGDLAATGLFRRGLTQHFTGQLRAELSDPIQDISLGATWANVYLGTITVAGAASKSALGSGVLGRFGVRRRWDRFSISGDVQLASSAFTELGYNGRPAPSRQIRGTARVSLGARAGSLFGSYIDRTSPLFGRTRLVNAGYSVDVDGIGYFSVNAFHTLTEPGDTRVSARFTVPLGTQATASVGASRRDGATEGFAELQRSLPTGSGYGYRVRRGFGPNPTTRGQFGFRTDFGTYRVGARHVNDSTSYNAEARGGFAFIGGGVYPSRQIDGAFGLVKAPDLPNVTVYDDNHAVATTNDEGIALLPRLRPYQHNRLRLGTRNLPLGAQVKTLELDAVPRYQSGVVKRFAVNQSQGATFTVEIANGQVLPAGATVHIVGQSKRFPVGRHGKVYLTGLSGRTTVEAQWHGQSCRFTVKVLEADNPIPDLGTFQCSDITQ